MARTTKQNKKNSSKIAAYIPWILRIFLVMLFLLLLIVIITYARGYRFNIEERTIVPTGILAVTSSPTAAKVYVNGELKGITDLDLTLPADHYTVEVKKDGFTEWKQEVTLKGEIVTSLDAALFPKNPSLSPLTNLGVIKAVPVDQTDRVIVFTQNNDTERDGIYIFDGDKKPLTFFPPLRPLVLKELLPADVDFAKSTTYFDPEFKQAIIEFITPTTTYAYLIALNDQNIQPFDVSNSKAAILEAWNIEKNREILKILETYPKEFRPVASDSFHIISYSPDKTKVLYQAKESVRLPRYIIPPLIGSNQNQEERNLTKDTLYLYDKKEDKNFRIPFEFDKLQNIIEAAQNSPTTTPTPTPNPRLTGTPVPTVSSPQLKDILPILWYPDSRHLGILQEREVIVIDYDGTNRRPVYAGPFEKNFFLITRDSRLLILTNLNPQYNPFPDIYEVGSK